MKQGFVKVAAASCAVAVADVRENTRVILETIHKMEDEGAKVMVLPELALTGYTDFCRPSVGTGRKAV